MWTHALFRLVFLLLLLYYKYCNVVKKCDKIPLIIYNNNIQFLPSSRSDLKCGLLNKKGNEILLMVDVEESESIYLCQYFSS